METTEDQKSTISDSERIKKVIDTLETNPNAFAKKLGYSSHATIYHVINGVNSISLGLIDRIIRTYPNISYEFLRHGVGDVTLSPELQDAQMNLFNIPNPREKHPMQDWFDLPAQVKEVKQMLQELLDIARAKEAN